MTRRALIIFMVGFLIILAAIILCSDKKANAGGTGISVVGQNALATFNIRVYVDSVRVKFAFPPSNFYVDSLMHAIAGSGNKEWLLSVRLDSIGSHLEVFEYYMSGVKYSKSMPWLNQDSTFASSGGSGSGNGIWNIKIYALSTTDSTGLGGVELVIKPVAGGASSGDQSSDPDGSKTFQLNPGTYAIYQSKAGWGFTLDTLVVGAADKTDTVWGAPLIPAPPPTGMCSIMAWLTTSSGDTIKPTYIRYKIVKSDSSDFGTRDKITVGTGNNAIILAKSWKQTSSSTSGFAFNVYPNSVTSDTTSRYRFIAYYKYEGRDWDTQEAIVAVPETTYFNPFAQ